jgi:hypothetical protein
MGNQIAQIKKNSEDQPIKKQREVTNNTTYLLIYEIITEYMEQSAIPTR